MPTNAHAISFLTPDCCSNFFDFFASLFDETAAVDDEADTVGLLMYFDNRCDTVIPEIIHMTGAKTNIKRTITPCNTQLNHTFELL